MSSPTKQWSEVLKLLTTRREEILRELESKKCKKVDKKQCQQWVNDLCDLVLSYAPNQPTLDLVDIEATDWSQSVDTPSTTDLVTDDIKENRRQSKETASVAEEAVESKESCDDNPSNRVEPRFKGVIRGMESIGSTDWDSDWTETDSKSEAKKRKTTTTTRQTRSNAKSVAKNSKSNAKKKCETNDKTEESSNLWSTDGQVLGGDAEVEAKAQTPQELRQLMAKRTEERLAQLEARGAKGVVRLPATAPSDLPALNNNDKSCLRWKM